MKKYEYMKKPGYALATILILLAVAMFGAAAMITISVLESRISSSQQEGIKAYYVAEAGMQDAVWHLNTNNTWRQALASGTLNSAYNYNSPANQPGTGQNYSVSFTPDAVKGVGYAVITVIGNSTNNLFTSSRKIQTNIFEGTVTSPLGTNGFYSGSDLRITNGSAAFVVNGGDMFANNSITINSATVNLGTGTINTVGNYSTNSPGTITAGAIYSSNNPPATTAIAAPGIDFSYYANNNDRSYTPTQFKNLFSGSSVTLPGPVTYVSGDVSMINWAKNKTLNVHGMLVINGSFTINASAPGFVMNITDPGNKKSGLFVKTNFSMSAGQFNFDGVLYASGSISMNNTSPIVINGAIVAGGGIQMNTGALVTLNVDPTRIATVMGGIPSNVEVEHWEEEY